MVKGGLLCRSGWFFSPPAWASWVSSVRVCSTGPRALHVFVPHPIVTGKVSTWNSPDDRVYFCWAQDWNHWTSKFYCWEDSVLGSSPHLEITIIDGEFLSGHFPEELPCQWRCGAVFFIVALRCVWLRQVCSSPDTSALLVPWISMYFRIGCIFWGEILQFSLFLEPVLAACPSC